MSVPTPIVWLDLTSSKAPELRDFYAEVMGWRPEPVDMGDYADYNMTDATGTPVAGICHARGVNAALPPVWIAYFQVPDLDAALEACRARGGELIGEVRAGGGYRYAVLRDPVGAVCAVGQAAD